MLHVPTQHRRLRHGTSLIEVLVVLVILVVGILAISRLFPAGFLSLRGAENNSYASRLAQGTLDILRQDNASLADGIYMYRSDTQQFDPTYAPDNLKPFTANAAYNDINKARYVSNETVGVPAVDVNSKLSLHTLAFGPYDPNVGLTVTSTLWTANNGDSRLNPSGIVSANPSSFDIPTDQLQSGPQSYLVDLSAGKLAVPPAPFLQTFVLTVNGGTPVTVTVPALPANGGTYAGNWFATADTTTGGTALPVAPWTSVEMYRPYQDMTQNPSTTLPAFTADPYEYALYNPNTAAAGMQSVAFNPLAAGRPGVQPLQARLSYSTQDWHILHEDADVPAGGGTIRLALSNLKKVGDTQFDQTLFNGLGGSGYDIYLLDRDTGQFYGLKGSGADATQTVTNQDDNSVGTSAPIASVSYANGRVTLPAAFGGKHLRVFYAGVADWAVAVQKAPKLYNQVNSVGEVSALNAQTPNRYYLDAAGGRIAFPLCDAGKMVQIAIGSQTPMSVNIPSTTTPGQTVQYVAVGTVTGTPKVTVTGLSATALVIWHERDNWKSRSIDTLLTRLD